MFSRISYTLRETWASFQRNITLTVAAIITSAVSLLLVGSTFLIQKAFDNLLTRWKDGVELIVFVRPDATLDQRNTIEQALASQSQIIEPPVYYSQQQAYEEAKVILAGDPQTLSLLTPTNIPSMFKVIPITQETELVRSLGEQMRTVAGVQDVKYAQDVFEVVAKVSGFVRVVTTLMSVVLLGVAILLIWNTIRTAMFARRREIEVMKLVGATNWFIRIPFMLEGLVQGVLGAMAASVGLWGLNSAWTSKVKSLGDTDLKAMAIPSGYVQGIVLLIILIGAAAGAIGSGVAASRFLDV